MAVEQLKQLWQLSFGDSPEYTDFYFSRAYNAENTVTRQADGRIVSAAQFRHFDILCGQYILRGVYILGVCTHPDFRRKGLSAQIIEQILLEQARMGADLAFLIPSKEQLFDSYGRFGFGTVFTAWEEGVCADAIKSSEGVSYRIIKPPMEELYKFYNDFYRSLEQAVLKDREYFMFAMDDLLAAGGRIDVCGFEGDICGFAATEGNVVKELICLDVTARNTLLSVLLAANAGAGLKVLTPGRGCAPSPFAVKKSMGMARVLNPCSFLEKTGKSFAPLHIADRILPQNSGLYTVNEGRVSFSPAKDVSAASDISRLPAMMLDEPYANLLLN